MAYLTTKAVSSGIAATTIANSRISGGRATGGASFTSTTYGLEFTAPSPSFEVYGNTIDGGFASMTSGSAEYCSGAFINATNAGGSISGNIFFISEFEATNEAYKIGVYRSSASAMLSRYDNNATLYGNVWRSSTGYSNDATWLASTVLDNAFDKARTPGSEFASYGEGAELFADFMAQDWRPKAGALYVGKPGRPNPFSAAQLESYPALGLDLAGKARSASGPWARGAYEP
jgi:hypothetical protein